MLLHYSHSRKPRKAGPHTCRARSLYDTLKAPLGEAEELWDLCSTINGWIVVGTTNSEDRLNGNGEKPDKTFNHIAARPLPIAE